VQPHARLALVLGFVVTTLLCQNSLAADLDSLAVIVVSQNTQRVDNKEKSRQDALVILGLVDSLHRDVRNAIDSQLGDLDIVYTGLDEIQDASYDWPRVDKVIATGAAGCEKAADARLSVPVLCVLLTAEGFEGIVQQQDLQYRRNLTAIVIDQPVSRQAAVANKVYPALSRFAVLSQSPAPPSLADNNDIRVSAFRADRALAPQLNEVTISLDALIATPESAIFNRSTLRTVLLTAYGYGKPVIGYSRAYVKAGALITGYSTPEQVFRQVAELSDNNHQVGSSGTDVNNLVVADSVSARVLSPKYFSIVDNPSVAKSLRLTKLFEFSVSKSYEDKDFTS